MAEHQIFTEITVKKPSNKMSALYEIVAPPVVTTTLNPIKDSFTRQGAGFDTLNYGNSSSLVVGRITEVYRSFIQFDFSTLNPQYILLNSKLRLYYTGTFDGSLVLEAYTVNQSWQENSLTNSNRPSPSTFIIDKYTNNIQGKYVEFDFTDISTKWHKKLVNNDGFMIRIKNELESKSANFRSRESTNPPELIVSYYDTRVYSTGRSQVLTEIFVWNTGNKNVLTEITVGSVVKNEDIPTQLYVHRVDTPVESDRELEITATRPQVLTQINASIRYLDEVLTELEVRSDVTISKLDTELTVNRQAILTEVTVRERSEILTELEVIGKPNNDILSEITASRDRILTEIAVKYRDDIETVIEVSRSFTDEILTEVAVSRPDMLTEIYVKNRDDKPTQIEVRAFDTNSVDTTLSVTRDSILTEITVMEASNIPIEIFVKYRDDILTELTVHHTSSVLTEIDVLQKSDVNTELVVSIPKVLLSITVPYRDSNEILTAISPRILKVSGVDTVITVKRIAGAYAFII